MGAAPDPRSGPCVGIVMTSRALRFGIVIREHLVEERVVTDAVVTLGQSLRCTLSVPVDGLPREHVLVTRDGGRFLLHVPAGAEGRVGLGDAIAPLDGVARSIPLDRGARGKLRLGDATILFQELAAPPAAPRPQLPASVRGTFGDRIDTRLAAVLGISLLAHIGIAVYAWAGDVDTGDLVERPVAARYEQTTIDLTLTDVTPPVHAPTPGIAEPVPSQLPPRPLHPPAAPHPTAVTHDDATRLAAILTSDRSDGRGPTDMSRRLPGAELSQQLEEARTRHVMIGDDGHTSRMDDRARLGTTDGLAVLLPTLSELPSRAPERTRERIQIGPVHQDEVSSLTPEAVVAKIQAAYLAGLQRCYAHALKADATRAGKLSIAFTVSDTGKVIAAQATDLDREVDACMENQMSAWRFAIPRDAHGEPIDADFHVTLACQHS